MTPLPPAPPQVEPALWARLGRWLRLAWLVLLWERLWPLLLPVLCVVGLFVAFALFDLAPLLPGWGHALVLAVAVLAVAGLTVRLVLRLRLPDWDAAARRLERDSQLEHRPLAVLADHPATADPLAQALWQHHLRRAVATLDRLRLALPHPDMAARDPMGWRALVLLLLVIAATGSWGDMPRRLSRALDLGSLGMAPDLVEVWLTPPAHTGLAPLALRPDQDGAVTVPAGTTVLAVLAGGWGDARLSLAGSSQRFQRQPDGSQRVEARLERSGRLEVRQSLFTVAQWSVTVAADAVPSAAFADPTEADERGRLHLTVEASDDYGLRRVWVAVRRLGGAGAEDEAPVRVALPLAATAPREVETGGWFDLTGHPWAGTPVTLTPMAEDGAGQFSAGESQVLTLPERQFRNPVAAAVAERRRAIGENVAAVPETTDFLDQLLDQPDLLGDDIRTVLMLGLARSALLSENGFALDEVQELLWQAALRLEDGDLSSAERALDDARKALEEALDRGAGTEELQALLDAFQQALERTLAALMQQGARPGEPAPLPQLDGQVVGEDELRAMLDQLRELAQAGARDALRQQLAQLGQILQGLQPGGASAGGPAQQGLGGLRELSRRQQKLLDDSHRQALHPAPADGAAAAQAQRQLGQALEQVQRQLAEGLGEAPAPLAEAGRAMAGAAELLAQGEWEAATQAQAQALADLGRAAREVLEQLGGAGQGLSGMVPRDPLGRPQRGPGMGDDGATRVPDHGEVQRSRRLLDEIRRRAGENQRPEAERDYLRRLLRQF